MLVQTSDVFGNADRVRISFGYHEGVVCYNRRLTLGVNGVVALVLDHALCVLGCLV